MFPRIYRAIFYVLFISTILAAAIPTGNDDKPDKPDKPEKPPVTTTVTKPPVTTTVTKPPVTSTVTVTAPAPTATQPAGDCAVDHLSCCNSVVPADSKDAALILGLLGIVVQGVDVLVGLTCTPITVIGIGNGACSATPVCCEDNSFKGLINIGCVIVSA
jgi:hypothetical protein